jgi:hypothetical protein
MTGAGDFGLTGGMPGGLGRLRAAQPASPSDPGGAAWPRTIHTMTAHYPYPIQNFRKFDVFLRISDRIFPTFV